MNPVLFVAAGLVMGGTAGFMLGRLVGLRGKPAESPEEVRLRRQVRELTAELRKTKDDLEQEAATTSQIPFIVKKLAGKLATEAIPGIAVRVTKELFRAPIAGFFAVQNGSFVLWEGIGFPPEWKGGRPFSTAAGILGRAMERHTEISKEEYLGAMKEWPLPPSSVEAAGIRPDLVAPVVWDGKVHAALVVAGSTAPLDRKRPYMSMLGDMVATALKNSIVLKGKEKEAVTDMLTGLFNRNHFVTRFNSELRCAREQMASLSVLIFDIDHFKKVNDTYGHPAGDAVLRTLADLVRTNKRSTDLAARYGGEEFVVMMSATEKEQAHRYAERLRQTVADTAFAIPDAHDPLRITMSVGVASFPVDGDSPTELIKAADEALYEAKRAGRNRVVCAQRAEPLGGQPV